MRCYSNHSYTAPIGVGDRAATSTILSHLWPGEHPQEALQVCFPQLIFVSAITTNKLACLWMFQVGFVSLWSPRCRGTFYSVESLVAPVGAEGHTCTKCAQSVKSKRRVFFCEISDPFHPLLNQTKPCETRQTRLCVRRSKSLTIRVQGDECRCLMTNTIKEQTDTFCRCAFEMTACPLACSRLCRGDFLCNLKAWTLNYFPLEWCMRLQWECRGEGGSQRAVPRSAGVMLLARF